VKISYLFSCRVTSCRLIRFSIHPVSVWNRF